MPESFRTNPDARWRWTTAFFFAAVWFLACFFHLGDLGMYSDDWSLAQFNPVTHEPRWDSAVLERNYFWRPVLQIFLHYAFLLFLNHTWVLHLINVSCHALATFGVYALLRRILHSRQAAAAGSLVFMLFPFQYEVIFWSTAMTTGIPAGLSLVLALLVCNYAKRELASWRSLATMAFLSFFIACWYEQPAAILISFPFLYMAAKRRDESFVRSFLRIAPMMLACGIPLMIYILLLRFTAPAGVRGGAASFIHLDEIPARWHEVIAAARWHFSVRLRDALIGGLITGWRELAVPKGLLAAAAVGLSAGAWVRSWLLTDVAPVASEPGQRAENLRRSLWTACFCINALIGVWLPVFPIRGQILEARMSYCAAIGLGATVAFLLDCMLRLFRSRTWWALFNASTAFAIAICVWLGAISMLGAQTVMRQRAIADRLQTYEISAAAGSVPHGTIFVVLRDDFRAGSTGRSLFDASPLAWSLASWSATPALQWAFRRDNVYATAFNFWVPPPFTDADIQYLHYSGDIASGATEPALGGGYNLAWSRVVAFVITADGHASLVKRVHIQFRSGKPALTVEPILTSTLLCPVSEETIELP
jgi:hypothetical protein